MKNSTRPSRKLKISLLVFFFLVLHACVIIPVKPVKKCSQDSGVYQNALQLLSSRYETLEGKISIQLKTAEGKIAFSGHLYAKNPNSLRFSAYGIFHQLKFLLIKQGNFIAWKDFDSGRQYQGPLDTCPDFPSHLPLKPRFMRDFIRILFLNFPHPVIFTSAGQIPGSCQFDLSCAWGIFGLTVDPEYSLPLQMEKTGEKTESTGFIITFSDYLPASIGYVPHTYKIKTHGINMKIRFKTLKINPHLGENIFIPKLP